MERIVLANRINLMLTWLAFFAYLSPVLAVEGSALFCYTRPDKSSDPDSFDGMWLTKFGTGKSEIKQLFGQGESGTIVACAQFSPDGRKIAFLAKRSLYICNNDGSDMAQAQTNVGIPNTGEHNFSWNNAGIFWPANHNGTLYRYVPSSQALTTYNLADCYCEDGGHYERYHASADGRHGYFRRCMMLVDFNEDFSDFTCTPWNVHGHGDGMTLTGDSIFHIPWGGAYGHRGVRLLDRSDPPESWPVADEREMYREYGPSTDRRQRFDHQVTPCNNDNAWIGFIVQGRDGFPGGAHMLVWDRTTFVDKTRSGDTIHVPWPEDHLDQVGAQCWFSAFWMGPLPTANQDAPYIKINKNEIILAAESDSQVLKAQVIATNTGTQVLQKVSAGVASQPAPSWLDINVEGSGGNTQTVSITVKASLLSDNESVATIRIYGGGAANEVTFTVTALKAGALAPPSGLALQLTGDSLSSVSLAWTDNSATEDGFSIERSADNGGSWTEIVKTGADAEKYSDDNLTPGTYLYRVRAFSSNGAVSLWSNPASIDVTGIGYIRVTSPKAGDIIKAGSVFPITWESNRVGQIKIDMSTDGGLSWTTITATGGITEADAQWQNYAWSVPDIERENALISVEKYSGGEKGISGAFTISRKVDIIKPRRSMQLQHPQIRIADNALHLSGMAPHTSVVFLDSRGKLLNRMIVGKTNDIMHLPNAAGVYIIQLEKNGVVIRTMSAVSLQQ